MTQDERVHMGSRTLTTPLAKEPNTWCETWVTSQNTHKEELLMKQSLSFPHIESCQSKLPYRVPNAMHLFYTYACGCQTTICIQKGLQQTHAIVKTWNLKKRNNVSRYRKETDRESGFVLVLEGPWNGSQQCWGRNAEVDIVDTPDKVLKRWCSVEKNKCKEHDLEATNTYVYVFNLFFFLLREFWAVSHL